MISDTRRKIINLLQKDGRIKFSELGRILGISHVAVKKHINKMVKEDLLNISAYLNPKKLNAKLIIVLSEVESESLDRFVRIFSRCPRVVFFFTATGVYNLIVLFLVENEDMMKIIAVGVCCIRSMPGIRKSEVYVLEDIIYPKYFPIRIIADRKSDTTPCGLKCENCKYYVGGKCLACPATKYYRGPL